MASGTEAFDLKAYKRAQRDSWNERAEFWTSFADEFDRWNKPVSEAMFELAPLGARQRVLDVATGAGEPGLSAAAIVGPTGSVLGIDQVQAMVDHALAEADRRGLRNFEGRVMDADHLDLPDDEFDVLMCRFGVFFLPDPAAALREWRRVLKPGGRAVLTSYVSDATSWRSIPFEIIRQRGGLPPPEANEPSGYLLADGGAERLLGASGFSSWEVRTVHAPCLFDSLDACMSHVQREGSAFARAVAKVDASKRESIWSEVREGMGRFEKPGGAVEAVCDVIVAMGEK